MFSDLYLCIYLTLIFFICHVVIIFFIFISDFYFIVIHFYINKVKLLDWYIHLYIIKYFSLQFYFNINFLIIYSSYLLGISNSFFKILDDKNAYKKFYNILCCLIYIYKTGRKLNSEEKCIYIYVCIFFFVCQKNYSMIY